MGTSQGTHRLLIVHGNGALVETVLLPAGAGPHLTTFSPLGDYAYVSGMGNGDLYILRISRIRLRSIQRTAVGVPSMASPFVRDSKDWSDGVLLRRSFT